jgi:ferric-dicitrate binding protein FerR (iron transport regulator)
MEAKKRFEYLLKAYLEETIRDDEKKELATLLKMTDRSFLEDTLEQHWNETITNTPVFSSEASTKILQHILGEERNKIAIPLYRKTWIRILVAACLLAGVVGILLYNQNNGTTNKNNVAQTTTTIVPGGNKAVLTLADGSTIILDSAANGNLAEQGGVKVIKLDNGLLSYKSEHEGPAEMLYNSIVTPAGGQFQLTLSDGTKVWLNASSSLRFPAAFTGNDRQVSITGEAYFEVAKNTSKPFRVNIDNRGTVEVLGTSFNINSYSDEPSVNTTLMEGSVKITSLSGGDITLKPGQQARLKESITILNDVDTDEIVAWKTGWFQFNRADLPTIMRQVSRWYDVEVLYEGKISKKSFSGIVSRENDISDILKIMENAGIGFRIEGKKITVIQ